MPSKSIVSEKSVWVSSPYPCGVLGSCSWSGRQRRTSHGNLNPLPDSLIAWRSGCDKPLARAAAPISPMRSASVSIMKLRLPSPSRTAWRTTCRIVWRISSSEPTRTEGGETREFIQTALSFALLRMKVGALAKAPFRSRHTLPSTPGTAVPPGLFWFFLKCDKVFSLTTGIPCCNR
jgi:hypothetical protein